jgi:hypothetical protein
MKITQALWIIDDCGRRVARSQSTTNGAIKNEQSRETDNIGYTRHMTKVRENQRRNHITWTLPVTSSDVIQQTDVILYLRDNDMVYKEVVYSPHTSLIIGLERMTSCAMYTTYMNMKQTTTLLAWFDVISGKYCTNVLWRHRRRDTTSVTAYSKHVFTNRHSHCLNRPAAR